MILLRALSNDGFFENSGMSVAFYLCSYNLNFTLAHYFTVAVCCACRYLYEIIHIIKDICAVNVRCCLYAAHTVLYRFSSYLVAIASVISKKLTRSEGRFILIILYLDPKFKFGQKIGLSKINSLVIIIHFLCLVHLLLDLLFNHVENFCSS